jgi:hypothetical protein
VDLDEWCKDDDTPGQLVYSVDKQGSNVTFAFYSDGTINITTDAGFFGTTWVIFNASDAFGAKNQTENMTITSVAPYPYYSNIESNVSSNIIDYESSIRLRSIWDTQDNQSYYYPIGTALINITLNRTDTSVLYNYTTTGTTLGDYFTYVVNGWDWGVFNFTYLFKGTNSKGNTNQTGWYGFNITKFTMIINMTIDNKNLNITTSLNKEYTINATMNCNRCYNMTLCLRNDTAEILCRNNTLGYVFDTSGIPAGHQINFTINNIN